MYKIDKIQIYFHCVRMENSLDERTVTLHNMKNADFDIISVMLKIRRNQAIKLENQL